MEEENKTPEKELNEMEMTNLSDAEFKMQAIRMLEDLSECSKSIREEMKALPREIKKNSRETNSEGKETGIQINDLGYKKERNIQPEQNEETRIPKR